MSTQTTQMPERDVQGAAVDAMSLALKLIKDTWIEEHGNRQVGMAWGALEQSTKALSSTNQQPTVNEPIDVVVTKIGDVDAGVDGRDEYLLLRNREGDLSPDQAIAFLQPLVFRDANGPGSYFCTTVHASQKQFSSNTCICTVEHRYDV